MRSWPQQTAGAVATVAGVDAGEADGRTNDRLGAQQFRHCLSVTGPLGNGTGAGEQLTCPSLFPEKPVRTSSPVSVRTVKEEPPGAGNQQPVHPGLAADHGARAHRKVNLSSPAHPGLAQLSHRRKLQRSGLKRWRVHHLVLIDIALAVIATNLIASSEGRHGCHKHEQCNE